MTRPTTVQKLGESPVAANPLPIFSNAGRRVPLKLFNTKYTQNTI